jgi:hypothetical protein
MVTIQAINDMVSMATGYVLFRATANQ